MVRSEAVRRINEGLGFMAPGNAMEATIIRRLQEAQRDLEKGKTLPKFLLVEDGTLALTAGTHTVAKPTDFLRVDDENHPHWFDGTSPKPLYLEKKFYSDALIAQLNTITDPQFPSIYVVRNTVLDFVVNADQDYTLYWNYFKAADLLTTDIENAWLLNAPEWLIGEAGLRMAADARDPGATAVFQRMEQKGRAACFGDQITEELSGGPLQMGVNN